MAGLATEKGSNRIMKAIGRRSALAASGVLATIASAAGLAMVTRYARAAVTQGVTPQSAVAYRDTPNGSNECSNCTHFIPGPSAAADGHCSVVAGTISPHGWCAVWTAKS